MDAAETWARIGLALEAVPTPAGVVEITPASDHRIRVHRGRPVRARCAQQGFVYRHGDIDLIPAGQSDRWEGEDAGDAVFVRFAPALLRRTAQDLGLAAGHEAGLAPRHMFRDAQVEHIVWALEADRQSGAPGGSLYAESLGTALAAHLLGRYPLAHERSAGLSPRQLQRVVDFVEAHLDEDLSLGALAGLAGSSASHFKTLFKRSVGVPVHEYVVQRRVERARALLLRGGMPAAQVALEAGFSHQSHMARCMRRVLGVPPSALARAGRD